MNGKAVFWLIVVLVAIIGIAISVSNLMESSEDLKLAEQDVAEAEAEMWRLGREAGMSDAEIQADIDAAKAAAD